jgi:crotonobetainyl-CoA:carnitine CoA-transferase CaiB-like acyl-CoA transferase
MSESPTRTGPLKGIRIVDLTAMVFGPYATQIMADMGAEVIKVEPPAGDNTRFINAGTAEGLGGVFVNVNRGKKSVVLDLRSEEGKEALRRLIARADVFIHSMRGKAIAKLGFDYAAVKAIKPDIVYTNCYGYSRRGPDGDKPAYDDTIQAECGIPHLQELMTGKPDFAATIIADKVAGLTGLYATIMALFHRERTGEGQEVEVGMFETMASFMLAEHASGMIFQPPLGPAHYHRVVARNRKPYKTKDGHVAALVYNDKHWAAFVGAVSPEWATPQRTSPRSTACWAIPSPPGPRRNGSTCWKSCTSPPPRSRPPTSCSTIPTLTPSASSRRSTATMENCASPACRHGFRPAPERSTAPPRHWANTPTKS